MQLKEHVIVFNRFFTILNALVVLQVHILKMKFVFVITKPTL